MNMLPQDAHAPPTDASRAQAEKDVSLSKVEDGVARAVDSPTVDPEMERRVRRKLDMNLVPLVSALYLRECSSLSRRLRD